MSAIFQGRAFTVRDGLAVARPPEPVALFRRQMRVTGLRHGAVHDVQAADVNLLPLETAKSVIQFLRVAACKIVQAGHAKQVKIFQRGWPDGAGKFPGI